MKKCSVMERAPWKSVVSWNGERQILRMQRVAETHAERWREGKEYYVRVRFEAWGKESQSFACTT